MRRPLAFVGVLTVCGLATGLSGGATREQQSKPIERDKPVTTATVRAFRKAVDVLWVTVENKRDVPIAEWAVTLYADAELRRRASTFHTYRWSGLSPGGQRDRCDGPILPGDACRFRVDRPASPAVVAAKLTLVVFADGEYEGTREEITQFLQTGSPSGVKRTASLKPADVLLKAPMRFEFGTGYNLAIELENQRDTPLEAWSVRISRSLRNGYGGIGGDSAAAPLLGSENTRLQAHAKREDSFGSADGITDDELPKTEVTLAVWQDLSFEGSVASRDELFRKREKDAEMRIYWIDALREAARQPLDAGKVLEAKRAERRKASPSEGDLLSGDLQQWSAGPRLTPAQAAARLQAFADRLADEAQRLTRHLTR